MLQVASRPPPPPAFAPSDVDAALLESVFEDGLTSTEHSRDVAADGDGEYEVHEHHKIHEAFEATTRNSSGEELEWEDEDDDENDSDYAPEDDEEDEGSESEDDEQYRRSLEMQMDEHADEVEDFYLRQMLATRATLEGDEAAWVDRYIEKQREWKERHGSSIDEMDLDLRPVRRRHAGDKPPPQHDDDDDDQLSALAEAWNGRVSPYLPPSLRTQPPEFLLSLVAVGVFIAIALGVQFYVAFKAPLYS